jgi:hypothetical protein
MSHDWEHAKHLPTSTIFSEDSSTGIVIRMRTLNYERSDSRPMRFIQCSAWLFQQEFDVHPMHMSTFLSMQDFTTEGQSGVDDFIAIPR